MDYSTPDVTVIEVSSDIAQADDTPTEDLNQRLNLRAENISRDLKARPQWVVWKGIKKPDGKTDKVPFQPRYTNRLARTDVPSTWDTFDKAWEVFEKNPRFDGIGYVLSEDDPYVGFDYDNCINSDGELHEVVSRQVDDLDGYAEISPSGKGLRVIVRAKKPGTRCSTKKTGWDEEFAMYERTRFLTLTGRVLGGHTEVREAQEAVNRAYHAMFGDDQKQPQKTEGRGKVLLGDEELLKLALKSKKGDRFRRHHYDGDSSGYESRSEADLAHLADLCFWTAGDLERMVELFCRSGLYLREKGDRYVRFSASKAVNTHKGGYYSGERRETDPEVLELVEALGDRWWDESFPGVGGKTTAGLIRALISEGKRIGTVVQGAGLRVSISELQLSEIIKCHPNTVGNAAKRAIGLGILERDNLDRREEYSGAFILYDPRLACGTPKDTPSSEERCVHRGTTSASRPSVADLTTEHYRWRGYVGKGREQALCAYEAFGFQTDEEMARRFGWSRVRDLRRRYLDKLEELGLIETRGDKRGLVGDFQRAQDEVRKKKYSTIQLRIKRHFSHKEGRRISEVVESGTFASEEERDHSLHESNKRKRQGFRYHLEERRRAAKLQHEERREAARIEELLREEDKTRLLNAWNEETGLVEVAWPELVNGVVMHDPDCGCSVCGDEAEAVA